MEMVERIDLCLKSLQRVDEAVDRADGKSSIIAAANVGLASILVALFALGYDQVLSVSDGVKYMALTLFLLYATTSVFSIVASMIALFPRLAGSAFSAFFFGAISSFPDAVSFRARLDGLSAEDYYADIVEQIHANALIAAHKYRWLKRSVRFLTLSSVVWVIVLSGLFAVLVGA